MKLGTETGSLMNHILAYQAPPRPKIGMGVTVMMWTDRKAGTIMRVSPSGKTIWYTIDTATRIDKNGMSDAQEYAYTVNPLAPEYRARLGRDGRWKCNGHTIGIGFRQAYHDYSF